MKKIMQLAATLQYLLIKGGIALINALPYPLALSVGRFIGLLGWLVDPFHRRVAQIQLRHCLGEAYRPSTVRRVFMNHGDILVDTIKYAYMDDEEIRNRIVIEGKKHLDEALSGGKGLMMITGHIGNWEILAHLPRLLGIRFWPTCATTPGSRPWLTISGPAPGPPSCRPRERPSCSSGS
jgi:KDO2-lipid IV(A) lauroyltransferase